ASGALAAAGKPSRSPDMGYTTAAVADAYMPRLRLRGTADTAAIRAYDVMTTIILANDVGARRRLRGQPYRFGPMDVLLFLFAQLRAEDHFDFGHSYYLLVSLSVIRRLCSSGVSGSRPGGLEQRPLPWPPRGDDGGPAVAGWRFWRPLALASS